MKGCFSERNKLKLIYQTHTHFLYLAPVFCNSINAVFGHQFMAVKNRLKNSESSNLIKLQSEREWANLTYNGEKVKAKLARDRLRRAFEFAGLERDADLQKAGIYQDKTKNYGVFKVKEITEAGFTAASLNSDLEETSVFFHRLDGTCFRHLSAELLEAFFNNQKAKENLRAAGLEFGLYDGNLLKAELELKQNADFKEKLFFSDGQRTILGRLVEVIAVETEKGWFEGGFLVKDEKGEDFIFGRSNLLVSSPQYELCQL